MRRVGGEGYSQTPLFCQISIKSALNWHEYTNTNLWGGKSTTLPAKSGFTLAFKHKIRHINCYFLV